MLQPDTGRNAPGGVKFTPVGGETIPGQRETKCSRGAQHDCLILILVLLRFRGSSLCPAPPPLLAFLSPSLPPSRPSFVIHANCFFALQPILARACLDAELAAQLPRTRTAAMPMMLRLASWCAAKAQHPFLNKPNADMTAAAAQWGVVRDGASGDAPRFRPGDLS